MDMEGDDLASMADTVASKAGTICSDAAPPAITTNTQGTSQLAPIDVDADDLASMANTTIAPVESSSNSSSDSSISEDSPEGSSGSFTHRVFYCSAATSAAPPEDMVTELPEVDPDPVTEDADMPDHSFLQLSSVGDPQQTLGDGPPTAPPPRNPLPWALLRQARAGGCNSPQLVLQDLPLPVPAIILASATDTNPSPNEAPVPSTITTLLHGDGTGNGGTTLPLPSTCTTHTNTTLRSPHTQVSNSLRQTTLFPSPGGRQAIHTLRTKITQNIVPLTFPNDQTFGDPLDRAKPNGHICIAFCNIVGFPLEVHNNSKAQDLRAFQTQFQVDIFGGCESNLNWRKMPPSGRLYKWFRSHNPLRAVAGHNIHDDFGQ